MVIRESGALRPTESYYMVKKKADKDEDNCVRTLVLRYKHDVESDIVL